MNAVFVVTFPAWLNVLDLHLLAQTGRVLGDLPIPLYVAWEWYARGWTARDVVGIWRSVASSADGGKLVAGDSSGMIYTSSPNTTPGTGGTLSGTQYAAVSLQYMGGGQFLVINYVGNLSVQ